MLCRVIGADARFSKLEESGMAAAIHAAWARLNQVPSFEINVTIMPATAAPGSSGKSGRMSCFFLAFATLSTDQLPLTAHT